MVRLYQNEDDGITKELIRRKKLYLSKLAFWICKSENNDYVAISPKEVSNIIQERKLQGLLSNLFHSYAFTKAVPKKN